jgi:hypothetical protein
MVSSKRTLFLIARAGQRPRQRVPRLEALCRTTWPEAERILRPPAEPIVDPLELLIEEVTRLSLRGLDGFEPERG